MTYKGQVNRVCAGKVIRMAWNIGIKASMLGYPQADGIRTILYYARQELEGADTEPARARL